MKRIVTSLALSALALSLAGCGAGVGGFVARYSGSVGDPQGPARAAIHLPADAGAEIETLLHDHPDGWRQDVILRDDGPEYGQNTLSLFVLARPDRADYSLGDPLRVDRPDATTIDGELSAAFPTNAMTVSPLHETDSYGPFGFAYGALHGAACLYAWQWLDGGARPLTAAVIGGGGRPPTTAWRIRLCRRGTTYRRLLDLVRQVRLESPGAA
ncbi:MAG: cellulose biosynthesis protein BcsN, partial [Hyphomicrobiales bacterium]|nr:cellulose biosynthesis protein BcsN [Hyphomicrobiales bacterium]